MNLAHRADELMVLQGVDELPSSELGASGPRQEPHACSFDTELASYPLDVLPTVALRHPTRGDEHRSLALLGRVIPVALQQPGERGTVQLHGDLQRLREHAGFRGPGRVELTGLPLDLLADRPLDLGNGPRLSVRRRAA